MTARSLFRRLNAATIDFPRSIEAFADDTRALERAMSVVPFLYFYLLYLAFGAASQWLRAPLFPEEQLALRWPVAWLQLFSFDTAVTVMALGFLASMLVGAVFFSRRGARIIAFVGFFQYHAFLSSFGAPEHAMLVWFYPLFFIIFLPDIWRERETTLAERKLFLMAFFAAQIYSGVIYFLAGLGKVLGGISLLASGAGNFLAYDAFALHIAYWLGNTSSSSTFGPLVIEYPLLGWPLFLFMLYMQVFTIWAIFRPSLHRVWGALLISFHIATFLTMDILFINNIFLLAALFLNSPFEKPGTSWRERAGDLPLLGLLFRPYLARR